MKRNSRRPRLSVTTGGKNVVSHIGSRLLCDLADDVGLSEALSSAMGPTKKRRRGHDRGQVLLDLAVALADGAKNITDLRVLRNQPALFGEVASTSTAWWTLRAMDDATLSRIATARAKARRAAWEAGADPGFYVIDIDGTLVDSHSEKQGAAPTYKRGYGHYPIVSYLDATGESLAAKLRPGNAGSRTASDHIEVLDASLAQLPIHPNDHEVMVRVDTAGCSHGFIDVCRERGVIFFVGHDLSVDIARVIAEVPENRWVCALSADGTEERDWAQVTEITDLVDLSTWPKGTRMLCRREEAHPGAQLTFTDIDGHRFQVFMTDHPSGDVCFLDGIYRGRGRCECKIKDSKDTGLSHLPSSNFEINQAWLVAVMIAGDLLAWMKLICLDGELAHCEPKRLRFCLLHAAGLVVHSSRRTTLRIAEGWVWADELVSAFARLPSWKLVT